MPENFTDNLMRAAVAYLQFQCQMTCAREMFSRSYLSLGLSEKFAVDQAVIGLASTNYAALTRELLSPDKPGVGFLAGMAAGAPAAVSATDHPGKAGEAKPA